MSEYDSFLYQSTIKLGSQYRFSTVKYDNDFFRASVIDGKGKEGIEIDTLSKGNTDDAYTYFTNFIENRSLEDVRTFLDIVIRATCTTHIVSTPVECAQMFIFQNDRGKKPTDLEVIKAQFMYHVHLLSISQEDKDKLLAEITTDFGKMYKLIALLKDRVDEDDVLLYTLCVYENNLRIDNVKETVLGKLSSGDGSNSNNVNFVMDFTKSLLNAFEKVLEFYNRASKNFIAHTLDVISNQTRILLPFVIELLSVGVSDDDFEQFAVVFTKISVRYIVISTRARLVDRLNSEVFQKFSDNVSLIVNTIEWMRTQNGYWGYWNNEAFKNALYGVGGDKRFLWLYENHLRQEKGKPPILYNDFVENTEIEYIAPREECQIANNGYFHYDDDWADYVYCIGNCLVLSKAKNAKVSNKPFSKKCAFYTDNFQQKEVQDMTVGNEYWSKDMIDKRHKKITDFLLNEY